MMFNESATTWRSSSASHTHKTRAYRPRLLYFRTAPPVRRLCWRACWSRVAYSYQVSLLARPSMTSRVLHGPSALRITLGMTGRHMIIALWIRRSSTGPCEAGRVNLTATQIPRLGSTTHTMHGCSSYLRPPEQQMLSEQPRVTSSTACATLGGCAETTI